MKETWAKVLKLLRENKYIALFALVTSLDNIVFEDDKIVIQPNNEVEYQILKKNLKVLNEFANCDCIHILENESKSQNQNYAYLERLKDLFGDKLEIL